MRRFQTCNSEIIRLFIWVKRWVSLSWFQVLFACESDATCAHSLLILHSFPRFKRLLWTCQHVGGNSPVHADHAQGHDGGCAAHYIHADEYVAEDFSKQPFAPGEICHDHKGHHNYGHGQVGHCQRHQKVVGRLPQLLHHAHRDHHQRVPHHRHRRNDRQHHPDEDLLRAPKIQQLLPAWLVPHGRGTDGDQDGVETLQGAI